jgi:hypothetical protein
MGRKGKGQKGFKLSEGDVIKLGRISYNIREVKAWSDLNKPKKLDPPSGEDESPATPDTSGEYESDVVPEELEEVGARICRI